MAEELDPLLQGSRRTLEVGIGTGVVALGLRELGHRVVGLDLSPAMAARAAERLGPVVVLGDARRMPVADASVEQAYSVWVLHIVGDRLTVLGEVRRVLAPGGRYIVAPGHLDRPEGDEIGELLWNLDRRLDPRSDRVDDADELARLAPDSGLRVAEVRETRPRAFEMSPEELARNMEERVYSILWEVEDERWVRLVEPVLRQLRSMPDPDRPRRRVHVYPLIILEAI